MSLERLEFLLRQFLVFFGRDVSSIFFGRDFSPFFLVEMSLQKNGRECLFRNRIWWRMLLQRLFWCIEIFLHTYSVGIPLQTFFGKECLFGDFLVETSSSGIFW